MTTPQATPEELLELAQLKMLVVLGHPRPYIERYFKIQPDRSGAEPLVPMLFANEPNQEYYYEELFGVRMGWLKAYFENAAEPGPETPAWFINGLDMKDRKARWTAFVAAVYSAKMFASGGNHIFALVNAEDTFGTIHRFMDGFYNNMPEYARPLKGPSQWGVEHKVLVFPTDDGGAITSTFTVRTAANPNVGSGETPTDLWFDEYGKFPMTFSMESQISVRSSAPNASFLRGGTVGPQGPKGPMYEEIQQYKSGERQLTYLFRRWFDNPANAMPPGFPRSRPADMRDEDIIPSVGGGPNCEKELLLVPLFPNDGTPIEWRLRWRRATMLDAVLAAKVIGGGDEAASVIFQRDHCEDDTLPWLVAGRAQFNQRLLELQMAAATDPANILCEDRSIEGMRLRSWRPYNRSHVYIGGLDLGSGTGGDDTSLQILDATDMLFMAELHGNLTDAHSAVSAAVEVMTFFGNGILVIETNRFPGVGDHAKNKLRYINTWRPPMRASEKPEAYTRRPYGMHVGATHHSEKEPSAESLNDYFKGDFNNGVWRVANPALGRTMQLWNPDLEKHTPDRIAGGRLPRLALSKARQLQPVTGESKRVDASKQFQGWGRQRVRPFTHAR